MERGQGFVDFLVLAQVYIAEGGVGGHGDPNLF